MGNLAHRYGLTQAPPDPKVKPKATAEPAAKPKPVDKIVAGLREAISVLKGETKPASVAGTKPTGTKPQSADAPKSKGGRPPKHTGEPWAAAGVSRRTWFRQQKVKVASS